MGRKVILLNKTDRSLRGAVFFCLFSVGLDKCLFHKYYYCAMDDMVTKNFSRSEFACQCGCGADQVTDELAIKLQLLRDLLGKPIKITSGVRCLGHNIDIGGSKNSSHIPKDDGKGRAVDIACDNSPFRKNVICCATEYFNRIGIHKKFIHLDTDEYKSPDVIWVY